MSRSLIDGLNPPQREAVLDDSPALLVLAGAGSGKTRVITHRIAHLIDVLHVPPFQILALTFTNRAASEMIERVEKLVLDPQASDPSISTFHSLCARILRKYAPAVGLSPSFSIYDSDDQLSLLMGVVHELSSSTDYERKTSPSLTSSEGGNKRAGLDRNKVRELLGELEACKNAGINVQSARERARGAQGELVAEVYARYSEALTQANAVDFGDLILRTTDLLRENPRIQHQLRDRWRHILVDEFQDTNPAQFKLLSALVGDHTERGRTFVVVGDDDQSIYSWRGADVANMLEFQEKFAAKLIKLEQNYRSDPPILDIAAKLIARNQYRLPKTLWSDRGEAAPIVAKPCLDDRGEARFVSREIRRLCLDQQLNYSDFAVFYRTNAQSRILEEQLRADGVPHCIIGSVGFYDRAEIKDLLAYLRLLVNPSDRIALLRVLNVPTRGIGAKTLAELEALSRPREGNLAQTLQGVASGALHLRSKRALPGINSFVALMAHLRDRLDEPPSQLLQALLDETNFIDHLENRLTRSKDAVSHVAELVGALLSFESEPGDSSLAAFLERVTLDRGPAVDDEGQQATGVVNLMTIHSAKGLEFDTVFVTGLEDELLPYKRREEEVDTEEERRLCYVAFTRAKHRLFLSWASRRQLHGLWHRGEVSPFLVGLPGIGVSAPAPRPDPQQPRRPPAFAPRATDETVEPLPDYESETQLRREPLAEDSQTHFGETHIVYDEEEVYPTGPRPAKRNDKRERANKELTPGDHVTHSRYGVGLVLELEDRPEGVMATVDFPMTGHKSIYTRFLRRY